MTLASITPEKRAHLSSIGRLGGLAAAASIDVAARGRSGQSKFVDNFKDGHGCKSCPTILIPDDLPETERRRRSNILYRMHFVRLARRPR